MQYITSVTSKGQATIPAPIRKKLGLKAKSKVAYEINEKTMEVKLKVIPDFFSLMGSLKSNIKYNDKKADQAIGKMLAKRYLKTLKP